MIEATFTSDEKELAQELGHITAAEAAMLAKAANVRELYLNHIHWQHSAHEILAEASAIFPETIVANDLDEYKVIKPKAGQT